MNPERFARKCDILCTVHEGDIPKDIAGNTPKENLPILMLLTGGAYFIAGGRELCMRR